MSITLDVNNFLKNASKTTSNSGTGKMEAMLQHELGIAELPKESTSIFDEIEQLLRSNKFTDDSTNSIIPLCPLRDEIKCAPSQVSPLQLPSVTSTLSLLPSSTSTLPLPPSGSSILPLPSLSTHIQTSQLNLTTTAITSSVDDAATDSIFLSAIPPVQQSATPLTLPPVEQTLLNSTSNFEFSNLSMPNPAELTDMSDFLLTDDATSDPQLYSVEEGELQPITSPFMIPGIYKKLSNALVAKRGDSQMIEQTPKNVFISTIEQHGRIVHAHQFNELYVCANENGELPEELVQYSQRPVLFLEELEQSANEFKALKHWTKKSPKKWDALSKLAYDILKLSNRDHIFIDRKRNEIVRTNNVTRQNIIYRFLKPEDLNLVPHRKHENSIPPFVNDATLARTSPLKPQRKYTKLGRPRKEQKVEYGIDGNIIKKTKQKDKKETPHNTTETAKIEPVLRTRSGRAVRQRLPTANQKMNLIEEKSNFQKSDDESVNFIENYLADLKDSDYRCPKPISSIELTSPTKENPTKTTIVAGSEMKNSSPIKRNIPPQAICPTCNKIFLGRRMQRHFIQYPDHMQAPIKHCDVASSPAPPMPPSPQQNQHYLHDCCEPSLFRFLVSKLQKSQLSEDQRADLFLHEINDLVTQLQLRSSRLIRNTSGLHFVNARCSRVIGIPEGQYALDMTAIENEAPPPPPIELPEPTAPCILNFENLSSSALPVPLPLSSSARNLDYTALSMSLDDTLTDEAAQKLNLSAGGKLLPPSEESLLRSVDDLVPDGMQKLAASSSLLHPPVNMVSGVSVGGAPPVMHYDHASDNAVEAVSMKETCTVQQTPPILSLPVDFFQFKNNND